MTSMRGLGPASRIPRATRACACETPISPRGSPETSQTFRPSHVFGLSGNVLNVLLGDGTGNFTLHAYILAKTERYGAARKVAFFSNGSFGALL